MKRVESRTDPNTNENTEASAQNFQSTHETTSTVYQDTNVVSVLAPNIQNGSPAAVAASAQSQPVLTATEWLSSVTETINYTQHYGHSGK